MMIPTRLISEAVRGSKAIPVEIYISEAGIIKRMDFVRYTPQIVRIATSMLLLASTRARTSIFFSLS